MTERCGKEFGPYEYRCSLFAGHEGPCSTEPLSENRCEKRYPVPHSRDEPFEVTYRCGLTKGHEGPCASEPAQTKSDLLLVGEVIRRLQAQLGFESRDLEVILSNELHDMLATARLDAAAKIAVLEFKNEQWRKLHEAALKLHLEAEAELDRERQLTKILAGDSVPTEGS